MYSAKIVNQNGDELVLSFDNGIVFDISPLSGVDVDISSSQSFSQVGVSIEGTSVEGTAREIFGVIAKNEKENFDKISKTLSPFSKGKLYIGDRYCDFVVQKSPVFIREKSGRLTFNTEIFCAFPFWLESKQSSHTLGGVEPAFSFPVVYDSHIFGIRKPVATTNIYNPGNVKQSIHISFSTLSTTKNFGIINPNTGQFVKVKGTISEADVVDVYQEDGKLKVELTRNYVTTNIIGKITEGSTFFEFNVGDNIVMPFADEGVEDLSVTIEFNPAYTGVFV